jgi:hypothetical protein
MSLDETTKRGGWLTSHEVRRVGAERRVPDPALMPCQCPLQDVLEPCRAPEFDGRIGRARCEVSRRQHVRSRRGEAGPKARSLGIGGQEAAGDVFPMSLERGDGLQCCRLCALMYPPDVYHTLGNMS